MVKKLELQELKKIKRKIPLKQQYLYKLLRLYKPPMALNLPLNLLRN
jgi:hypothetical protein